jgi:glycosyltransferase involved in cell wall biosynthesis
MASLRKVLYLHHAQILGGAESSLLNLFRNLDRTRFEPVMACPDTGPFAEALREEGVEICPTEYPNLRNIFGMVRTGFQVRNLARRIGADILHGNTPRTNLPAAFAGRMLRVPVIWHMRNVLWTGQKDIERLFWKWPTRIVCNSEAIRRRFPSIGQESERVVAILNGVDLEEFHPGGEGAAFRAELGISSDQFVVALVGRVSPEKGHRTFLRAAARLHAEIPKMHFVLVGEATQEDRAFADEIRERARELGDSVVLAGFRRDMPACYAASDVVVLPTEVEEGCGRVLFETMASQKPIIATNSGGTPEVVQDGESGFLFPPRDDEILAGLLCRLYRDGELRQSLGRQGRYRAESEFSIQGHVRRIEALYEQVLQEAEK